MEVQKPKPEYGSDVIMDLLQALDIEYLAMNPGASFLELHESAVNYTRNRKPEIILCLHEEVAVTLAHGYNKVAAKPMAAIVHNIVGLLHGTMAIFNAWVDRAPVLILGASGPMAIEQRLPNIHWIHTSMDQGSVVRDYVKLSDQVTSLPGAIDSILRGYQLALTEPKGPVYICVDRAPQEKLNEPLTIPDVRRYAPPSPVQGDPAALKQAAELLVAAEHPVIIADYVGKDPAAVDALIGLAELLSVPVLDNGNMFSFPNTHPLDLTGAGKELLGEADLVLCLDVLDLAQALTAADPVTRRAKYIIPGTARIVDISLRHFAVRSWVQDYGKLQPVDLSISADVHSALLTLTSLCQGLLAQRPEKANVFQKRHAGLVTKHNKLREGWRAQAEAEKGKTPISVPWLASEIWEVIKDRDWVLTNRALNGWARQLWDWTKSYQYVGGSMGAALGCGIGFSLGVALAHKPQGRLCINIQPDGDLLYSSSGLWTAANSNIPLLTIMFNNRSYYGDELLLQQLAKRRGRPAENAAIGNRIDNPPVDFARLAQSFGLYAEGPIEKPEDLRPALRRAVACVMEKKQAALVDVVTQPR